MKRRRAAREREDYVDRAIDAWVNRRGVPRKLNKGNWVDRAIDSWIQRRYGRPGKSSKNLRTVS